MLNRRGLLLGLASALASPAIVHYGNLMPVKRLIIRPDLSLTGELLQYFRDEIALGYSITRKAIDDNLYEREAWLPIQPDWLELDTQRPRHV